MRLTSSRPAGWPRRASRSRSTTPATSSGVAETENCGSAPTSTRFLTVGAIDGVLGVVGAIEIAERVDVPLTVVAFRDEERGYGGSLGRVALGGLPQAFLELHIEQGASARPRRCAARDRDGDCRPGAR